MRKEIVDIDDGKPSARAQKLPCRGRKKRFSGWIEWDWIIYNKKNMLFFKHYPSVISISRMR